MKSPDGTIYPMNGTFKEIIKPEKIVFVSGALDKNGDLIFEVLNIVTFENENGKTKFSLHAIVDETPEAKPYLDGMDEGWAQSLDRLSVIVSNM
jgi:uncharacterized protein YndB with AHSA1/START domain